MNCLRRLRIFVFACLVVSVFEINPIYAEDNAVDLPDPHLEASYKIHYGNATFRNPISSAALDQQFAEVYQHLITNASTPKQPLLPNRHRLVRRVRAITHKLTPYAVKWNEQVKDWHWEVNIIRSTDLFSYVLPGGKIIISSGMLNRLQLNDHQIALLLAHEITHALREHVRAHLSAAPIIFDAAFTPSTLFGPTQPSITLPSNAAQLLSVQYSHTDETEADVMGADIAARAGYDPRAAITLWQRLSNQSKSTPIDFVTMHPFAQQRIKDFKKRLPELLPIYNKARRKANRPSK